LAFAGRVWWVDEVTGGRAREREVLAQAET